MGHYYIIITLLLHHKSYREYEVGATWQAVRQFVYCSSNVALLHPTLLQFLHGAGELEGEGRGSSIRDELSMLYS